MTAVRKLLCHHIGSGNQWTAGTRHVEFVAKLDHEHANKRCLKYDPK
jgi:hypothetical protein